MRLRLAKVIFYLAGLVLLISCHILDRQSSLNQSFFAPTSQKHKSTMKPGRYVGYIRLVNQHEKAAFLIDMIEVKAKGNQSVYKAILRINLGGFSGSEYHGEYFSTVVHDTASNKISFSQANQSFHVTDVELKSGSMITGKITYKDEPIGDFMSIYSERKKIDETYGYVSKMYPDLNVLSTINGLYVSTCNETAETLQLTSSRWQAGQETRDLFSEFKIQGTIDGKLAYGESVYDFINSELALANPEKYLSKNCKFVSGGMNCDSCFYERVKLEGALPEKIAFSKFINRPQRVVLEEDQEKARVPVRPDFPGVIEGEYYGHLFNETTEVYQPIRLKVNADLRKSDGMTKPSLAVTAIANLFFGPSNSGEFLVYPFAGGYYSDSAPYFVFSGKGEAFLQVSKWYEGSLQGIWYSKTYGRVGSVILKKHPIQIPQKKHLTEIKKLSGTYSGPEAKFSLLAQSGVSMSSYNFFPLGIKGVVVRAKDSSSKGRIEGASLDFYTGKFAMKLATDEIIVGEQTSRGIDLFWGAGGSLGLAGRRSYDFQEDPFSETSAMQMFDLLRAPFIR